MFRHILKHFTFTGTVTVRCLEMIPIYLNFIIFFHDIFYNTTFYLKRAAIYIHDLNRLIQKECIYNMSSLHGSINDDVFVFKIICFYRPFQNL